MLVYCGGVVFRRSGQSRVAGLPGKLLDVFVVIL
jgi:hypothetical protein